MARQIAWDRQPLFVQPFAEMTIFENVLTGVLFAGRHVSMKNVAESVHHYRVMIEHVLRIMLSLVEKMIVLHHGAMLSDGPSATVLNDEAVIKAYLGTKSGKCHKAALGYLNAT